MIVFKDLVIEGDKESLDEVMENVQASLVSGSGWRRSLDKEREPVGSKTVYVFERNEDDMLPAAVLSIYPKGKDYNVWYVPNVVPKSYVKMLSISEYNAILTEFYEQILCPYTKQFGIITELTSGQVAPADILGVEAAELLENFSDFANKSTGSSHPRDREHWYDFIEAIAFSKDYVDVGLLQRILEEQGWDEESAVDLVIEFEFGFGLIKHIKR